MKKIKISLILNIIIVLLVIIGCIFMFNGYKFMPGAIFLEATKAQMFKFYTVDSNILLGVASLILIINELKLLNKKVDKISNSIYMLKFVATSSIALTFFTTAFFLAPQYGFYAMYNNSNLFFHLIVPILSILSYIVFEKHNNNYKYALFGIIPMFIYSIYYISRILIHLNDGGLTFKYDFYGFLQGNLNNIYFVIPIIYIITYLMSILIIYFNKKISIK